MAGDFAGGVFGEVKILRAILNRDHIFKRVLGVVSADQNEGHAVASFSAVHVGFAVMVWARGVPAWDV